MRTEPRFVKPSDYNNYTGKDLMKELKANSNESNKANIFIMQIEDMLLARIDKISFRLYSWDKLSPYQYESLQKAIIFECEYIIRNSNIFLDSGYNLERGEIISKEKLANISICDPALDQLTNCGLLNHKMRNRPRYLKLW